MIYGNLGDLELIEYGEIEKISKTVHFFFKIKELTHLCTIYIYIVLRIKIVTLNELLINCLS